MFRISKVFLRGNRDMSVRKLAEAGIAVT